MYEKRMQEHGNFKWTEALEIYMSNNRILSH